jgi:hypothetical protein
MALTHRARKRLSLLILVVGLPLYIIAVWVLLNWIDDTFGRLPILAEMALYIAIGVLWALPLRAIFRGVGQPDPDAMPQQKQADPSDPPV